jgi:hypothetical protein
MIGDPSGSSASPALSVPPPATSSSTSAVLRAARRAPGLRLLRGVVDVAVELVQAFLHRGRLVGLGGGLRRRAFIDV